MKLLAPNGKPSKLTPKQYKIVRTPEFKAWFGFWDLYHYGKAKNYYEPSVKKIAKELKEEKLSAINEAVDFLSKQVTENDVLIPMPSRYGIAKDTRKLAQKISEKTGAKLFDCLVGKKRESVYEMKKNNQDLYNFDFNFQINCEIPKAKNYFIVDNVIGTGVTMKNALQKVIKNVGTNVSPLVFAIDLNNISKVVDENGEPLVVWHGTKKGSQLYVFLEKQDSGSHFGTKKSAIDRRQDTGDFDYELIPCFLKINKPLFVDEDMNWESEMYSDMDYGEPIYRSFTDWAEKKGLDIYYRGDGIVVNEDMLPKGFYVKFNDKYKRYIVYDELGVVAGGDTKTQSIEHALSMLGKKITKPNGIKTLKELINDNGYDGIFYVNEIEDKGNLSYLVIEPNKIKLADGTNTTFDGKNPDIRYNYGGNVLLAPNGNPSNLSPEQYKLVRTPEFKAWFGDWENSPKTASKVVDENGEPLVVWHTSPNYFNTFDAKKSIKGIFHFGTIQQAIFRLTYYIETVGFDLTPYIKLTTEQDEEMFEIDIYWKLVNYILLLNFYDKNDVDVYFENIFNSRQKEFIKNIKINIDKNKIKSELDKYNIKPYFLRVKKLGKTNDVGENWELDSSFFDGYMYINLHEGNKKEHSFIVFNPNQIKLADGTNTTFDSNNSDIRYNDGGEIILSIEKVEKILGRKLHWWNDDVVTIQGSQYKKVFLKSEYRKI